jgi:hypothetical protein
MTDKTILFGVIIALCASCDTGPTEVKSVSSGSSESSSSPSSEFSALSEASQSVLHQVEAKEFFDSERYTYVRVAEGDEEYWVAISKQPVEVGKKYVFQKGLMKKNFFSPEFNRVFETLYLVSDFRPMGGTNQAEDVLSALQSGDVLKVDPNQITRPEGSVPLSELFKNMAKYNGKQIVVTGKVVKVNPMIMGRNWIHIQDGTVEGKDLTVTTMENIPLGHVVSFEGTIALNKDFGAGYRYDIILEGAVVKK